MDKNTRLSEILVISFVVPTALEMLKFLLFLLSTTELDTYYWYGFMNFYYTVSNLSWICNFLLQCFICYVCQTLGNISAIAEY